MVNGIVFVIIGSLFAAWNVNSLEIEKIKKEVENDEK